MAKFAAMTGRTFIQVILPLRLEWEPFYYVEGGISDGVKSLRGLVSDVEPQAQRPESALPHSSMGFAASEEETSGGREQRPGQTEWRDGTEISVGDRVRVNFAGKEYVGVVSASDAGKEAEVLGIVDKVKPIVGMEEGLEPVGKEEIELWRQIAEYYLCTVGEVYKAAYPAMRVEEEAVQARREALAAEREAKNRARQEAVQAKKEEKKKAILESKISKTEERVNRLRERIAKKEELILKARKAEARERYVAEKADLEKEVAELVEATKHWKENSNVASTGSATEGVLSSATEGVLSSATEEASESSTDIVASMVGERCRTTDSATERACSAAEGNGSATEGKEIVLSAAQEAAYSKIKEIFGNGKPALLKGVTGSGKTEIYLKLAQEALRSGKNVLYLVPEIALSRQLEDRIRETFPEELLVFHSGETMSRKRETAAILRRSVPAGNEDGHPSGSQCDEQGDISEGASHASSRGHIVLGTRSAIFLPHKNLGLIIIDEEHDTSYKQDSPAPRYNGRESAIMMAKIFSANVILGSATPSLESLYNCSVGRYGLVTLDKRFYDAADSDIEIIDTIAERRKNGMIGSFSRKLIEHINKCLAEHRQVLILRERRAYSPLVQCQSCGEIPRCGRCNVSLSLHRRGDGSERLVCHYCGRVYEYTGRCPKCGGEMKPLGAGTQKIEEEAAKLFPSASIARLDSDTAQSRRLETDVIRKFSKGEIDILIGTRMVAKGFDFSGLTLVAVLQADSILWQEDYRADERGLQLLEQFRGRCGRRGEKGLFVIQTSQPEHPVYQSIDGKLDGNGTVERFLGERKMFGYPPYSRVIGIIVKDYNQARVDLMSQKLAEAVRSALGVRLTFAPGTLTGPSVIGPYSPAVDKISGQNIRQIRVLLPKDRSLSKNKATLAAAVALFEKDRKYSGHIALDVDPA